MLARGLRLGVNLDRLDVPEIKISNIMTKDLFTVLPENTVEEAVRKMVERDVECLPVISTAAQFLIGIITFRDIVTKFVCARACAEGMKVSEIMSDNLITCSPDSSILDVVKIMKNKYVRRIPVINSQGVLVGLVTNSDLALFGWKL